MTIKTKTPIDFDYPLLDDVLLAQTGDHAAIDRLIRETQTLVHSLSLSIVRDLDLAQEVTQKVYIIIWQKLSSLKNANSFLPWLRQTTRNTAYNLLREQKISTKIDGEEAELLLAKFSDPDSNLEQSFDKAQKNKILADFIESLPQESREIILLYYREEQSSKQVAQLLDISEANVRKRLSRIRATLKSDILKRYGQLILASAPGLTLTSAALSSLSVSSPVAAATLSISSVKAMPWYMKICVALGGAMIGAFAAIAAIFLGYKLQLKQVDEPQVKQKMITYRNQLLGFTLIFGLVFSGAYTLTEGWIAPILAYTVFILGLAIMTLRSNKLFMDYQQQRSPQKYRKWTRLCSNAGLLLGALGGFTGLIYGLINSGRLVF